MSHIVNLEKRKKLLKNIKIISGVLGIGFFLKYKHLLENTNIENIKLKEIINNKETINTLHTKETIIREESNIIKDYEERYNANGEIIEIINKKERFIFDKGELINSEKL